MSVCVSVRLSRLHPKRIFQTVRNVNQTVRQRSTGPSPMNIPGSNQTSSLNSRRSSCVSTPRSSMYGGSMMDNRASSMILEGHTPEDRSAPADYCLLTPRQTPLMDRAGPHSSGSEHTSGTGNGKSAN